MVCLQCLALIKIALVLSRRLFIKKHYTQVKCVMSAAVQWEMLFSRVLNTFDVLSKTEKASIPLGDHKSSGHRSIYKLILNEVLMVILWSLKLSAIDYENSRRHHSSQNLSTRAWRTLTMSSLNDLHCTKDDTSVTAPFISMETTLTGMATVRPVRTAVLIISVSWIWKRERE